MSLRLDKCEELIRIRTQHRGDTIRLTQTIARIIIYEAYQRCRTELHTIAPNFGVQTTNPLVLATGDVIQLSSVAAPFEEIKRFETNAFSFDGASVSLERWIAVWRGSDSYPGEHERAPFTFEKRGGYIYLLPEGKVSGTFRLHYFFTPTELTVDSQTFDIPPSAEEWFKLLCCIGVARFDRDTKAEDRWEALADKQKEKDRWNISREYGAHGDGSGVPP